MSNSFALIIDEIENFEKLVVEMEKFFDVEMHWISENFVNGLSNKNRFYIDATPSKMHFIFPENNNKENINNVIDLTKNFLGTYMQNQNVGVVYYGENNSYQISEVPDVKIQEL